MYECLFVCILVCIFKRMHLCFQCMVIYMFVSMFVSMFLCMFVYVCMYFERYTCRHREPTLIASEDNAEHCPSVESYDRQVSPVQLGGTWMNVDCVEVCIRLRLSRGSGFDDSGPDVWNFQSTADGVNVCRKIPVVGTNDGCHSHSQLNAD